MSILIKRNNAFCEPGNTICGQMPYLGIMSGLEGWNIQRISWFQAHSSTKNGPNIYNLFDIFGSLHEFLLKYDQKRFNHIDVIFIIFIIFVPVVHPGC